MLLACRFDTLELAQIAFPHRFPIFLYTSSDDVTTETMLRRFGILRPLPVVESPGDGYQLLAEFAPFMMARKLGLQRTTCQIFPASTPVTTLMDLQALLLRQAGETSPVVHAWLASQAHEALDAPDLLALLDLMGYKPQPHKLKELIDLLQLESSILLALHQARLAYKSVRQLTLLDPEDQKVVVRIISAYRLGGSKQQKLLDMLVELVMRENKSVLDLVGAWLPEENAADNLPQRAQHLLDFLQANCYPARTAAEKDFQGLVRKLQPPEGITIDHGLNFEDDSVEVRLRFTNGQSLQQHWPTLRSLIT